MEQYRYLIAIFMIFFTFVSPSWSADEAGFCIECVEKSTNKDQKLELKKIAEKTQQEFNKMTFLDPELVEKMDSRVLGEMIVKRIHEICDKGRGTEVRSPLDNKSEIMMLVPDRHIESIAKFGFKNQHQTGVTGGCNCKESRLQAEMGHAMMGLPYTNKTRELLPKYALQVFQDTKQGQHGIPFHYGNVIFRFKSEVNRRATWTYTDSLGLQGSEIRTNQIQTKSGKTCGMYCEAQVWGELDLSDVKSIIVPEGMEVTEQLKSLGLPIYTYKNQLGVKSETSLQNFQVNQRPTFTPKGSPIKGKVNELSVDEGPIENKKTGDQAPQDLIQSSNRIQQMSTAELIDEYKKTSLETTIISPKAGVGMMGSPGGMMTYASYNTFGKRQARLLAEISARPKTDFIENFLIEEYKATNDRAMKALALSGLSDISWDKLKPLILPTLAGADQLGKMAAFLAIQHLDDPDIQKAFKNRFDQKVLLDWFQGGQYCQKD